MYCLSTSQVRTHDSVQRAVDWWGWRWPVYARLREVREKHIPCCHCAVVMLALPVQPVRTCWRHR